MPSPAFGFHLTNRALNRRGSYCDIRFFTAAREQHFPVAVFDLSRCVIETLFGQNAEKRFGFKRREQQKIFVRAQLRHGTHDF